jgi:hypothetical protein
VKLIRVFPRKTNATPDDEGVRFGLPTLFDQADEVHVSVTWTWDKPQAEKLANAWRIVTENVSVGGPAYNDQGDEFEPGKYLKQGYVITSRGCTNHCWFCSVPKREGNIREIAIKDGWNVLDNNLLACSRKHIEKVFQMLERQPKRPRLTGGLEAARLEEWHVEWLARLHPETAWFAYDTKDDWEPLVDAANLLRKYQQIIPKHKYRCYVLVGWAKDTIDQAEKRLWDVAKLGLMPMAMLYDHGAWRNGDRDTWISFAREWASPWIVGTKMNSIEGE